MKSRANVRRLAPPAVMIAAIACGIIAVASCTNGTAYDGAYEGGFSAGPDGSTVITIAPGAAGPLVYRAADGAFGVYFKQGTFAASATITISAQGTVGKTDGGPGGPGYAVKIEGAAPTMPYAVFFNSNGGIGSNGNAITANDVLLGVQGNAGGGVFGIAEQTTTNATFAFVPISSGGGQGEPQLPACLAGCNLQANNGSNPYCSISGASNNDVIATFDCIIGCPDPATLGAQCSSTSHNLRCGSKTCVTNQVCCRTGSTAGDSALQCEAPPCTEKLAQFECVTKNDCSGGAFCCATAGGTTCSQSCAPDAIVCDDDPSVCPPGDACNLIPACSGAFPAGNFHVCGQSAPSSCPVKGGGGSVRAIACGVQPGPTCMNDERCCLSRVGGQSTCLPPSMPCGPTHFTIECLGPSDCTDPGKSMCCAVPTGTACSSGCGSNANVVCNNGMLSACSMIGAPGPCAVPQQCIDTGVPIYTCGDPGPCPIIGKAVPCGGVTCTKSSEMCCLGKANGGSCNPINGGACDPVAQYILQCMGTTDCPSGQTCCANPTGTTCTSGGCAKDHQVCTNGGVESCGGGGTCMPSGACNVLGANLGQALQFCMDPGATCPITP